MTPTPATIDPTTGALVPPLVQSTTYAWTDLDHPPAVSYARAGNPTTRTLEIRLAQLEDAADAVCFGSGLAAIDAVLRALPDGARVVAGRHLYGGTTRLLSSFHANRLTVDTVDSSDNAAVSAALSSPADLVLVETPSNPTLRITDLPHIIRFGHDAGALVAVDNTFLTPLDQRPLDLGADLSIHSTTKYLDGHNATLGGAVVVPEHHAGPGIDQEGPWSARLRWVRQATGITLAPFEAWLTLQGTKTLRLRTERQWANATRVAEAAAAHPVPLTVHYPGLPDHPGHDVHRRQANGDGGIIALDLGSLDAARTFVTRLRHFTLAENLGATESLVTSPALMTHAALPPERRHADGIDDGLVRLSVGIEPAEHLVADLVQALDAVRTVPVEVAA